ncbi:MAG: 50S ribosomal protein L3 [Candidatus Nanoarchaeia archaeon]
MGHIKRKRPRRGSQSVWPRKRANRIYPAVTNWAHKKEAKLLGFAGYKAGMTSVIFIDNRPRASTKGEEVRKAVTILEAPPIKVAAVRLYASTPYGLKAIGELWAEGLDKDKNLLRKVILPKKRKTTLETLKAKLQNASEIRVVVHMRPADTGLGKKTPEVFEIGVGGTPQEAFNYASSVLGKEVSAMDVFKAGEFVDAHAVTKGKGFEGDIKRYGVKLERHKAEFGQRHRGTMGPITPPVTGWWVLQPGQMGFHKRTEHNKQILRISDSKTAPITPVSGLSRYGIVKSQYILIAGSVPGAKKRLIVLSHPTRPFKSATTQAPEIIFVSTRSQQG